MICDSGTPLLRSKVIAFTAEYPVNTFKRLDISVTSNPKNVCKLSSRFFIWVTTNLKLEQGQGVRHVCLRYL